jgi:hypothetical protein
VDVEGLKPPYRREDGEVHPVERTPLPPWFVIDRALDFSRPPSYVDENPLPLFYVPPPRETRTAKALKRIATMKFHREVRRIMKKELRREFIESPSMPYSVYERRLAEINQLGRNPQEFDPFNTDYFSNRLKDDLFEQSSREGEEDFALLAWGPFLVMDDGSLRLDVGRVLHEDISDVGLVVDKSESPEGADSKRAAVLASQDYRVHSTLRLSWNPVKAVSNGDPSYLIDRYGLTVGVDWLSAVLGRRIATTEVEVSFDRDGDFAALLNIVFKSRR